MLVIRLLLAAIIMSLVVVIQKKQLFANERIRTIIQIILCAIFSFIGVYPNWDILGVMFLAFLCLILNEIFKEVDQGGRKC